MVFFLSFFKFYSITPAPVTTENINFRLETTEENFTGRSTELELLKKISKSADVEKVAVAGMGGVGKTQLLKEFICRNRKEYSNVIWIDAETAENIEDSFTKLSIENLQLKTTDANGGMKNSKSVIEQVYNKLGERKTLYVFDNVDSNSILTFILARAPPCGVNPHIIITSRLKKWPDGIKVISLKVWTPDESVEFISDVLKDCDSENDKKLLAEKLQHFPLALRQATAYIQFQQEMDMDNFEFSYKISDYIQEFEDATKDILDSTIFQEQSLTPYQKTTYTTWIITMEKIQKDKLYGRLAIKMLNMMAYFLPDNIDTRWFLDIPWDDENRQINDKKRKLYSATQLLVKYCMVDSKERKGILGIHRLVQKVIKLKVKESDKQPDKEEQILRDALIMFSKDVELNYVARNHKISVFESALAFPDLIKELSSDKETIPLIAGCYLYKKKYDDALTLIRQLLELQQRESGDDHHDTVRTKYGMAEVLTKLGLHSEAHQLLNEVYETKKKTCKDDPLEYLKAKQYFATSLYKQGQWNDALTLYEEVLESRKSLLKVDHPDTLMTKHNIAMSRSRLGQFVEARHLLEEIYETKKNMLGDDHPDVLRTKSKIAQQTGNLKEHRSALELYREIYEKRKNIFGDSHVDTLSTKMKMALQHGELGEHTTAILLLEEVCKTEEETLGVDHPATLRTKSRIAKPTAQLGRHDEALQLLDGVFAKQKNLHGDDHPETVKTKQLVAAQHRDMDHVTIALQLFMEIHETQQRILGDNHSDTLKTKSEMDLQAKKIEQFELSHEEHENQKRELEDEDISHSTNKRNK